MPRCKRVENSEGRHDPPALTVDGRFDQLVSMAVNLAEERLREKTASNQLIAEIIRYGSQKEKLAREKIIMETEMLKAKKDALRAQETSTKMFEEAMKAFRSYSPTYEEDEEEEYDEDEEC